MMVRWCNAKPKDESSKVFEIKERRVKKRKRGEAERAKEEGVEVKTTLKRFYGVKRLFYSFPQPFPSLLISFSTDDKAESATRREENTSDLLQALRRARKSIVG